MVLLGKIPSNITSIFITVKQLYKAAKNAIFAAFINKPYLNEQLH
jgi:hypothetical protein